jgi:hypothetical protein
MTCLDPKRLQGDICLLLLRRGFTDALLALQLHLTPSL